jgi:hypothetical protein
MTSSVAQIGARPFRAARPGCAPVVRRLTLPVGRRDSQGASFGVSRAARRGRGSVGRSDGQTSVAARRAALLLAVKRTPSLPAMLIRSGSLSTRPTLEHCSAKRVTNAAIRGFVPSRGRLLSCRLNCRICGIGVLHLAGLTNSAEYRLVAARLSCRCRRAIRRHDQPPPAPALQPHRNADGQSVDLETHAFGHSNQLAGRDSKSSICPRSAVRHRSS